MQQILPRNFLNVTQTAKNTKKYHSFMTSMVTFTSESCDVSLSLTFKISSTSTSQQRKAVFH